MGFETEITNFIKDLNEAFQLKIDLNEYDRFNFDVFISNISAGIKFHHLRDTEIKREKSLKNYINPKISDIKIIHIWEDQWNHQKEKVKSKLRSLFGVTDRIHGRETKILNLNNSQLLEFLQDNHLNVPIKGKYKFGLTYDDELVAVMSFSKGRGIIRDNEFYNSYELLRFCNKLNHTVVGGFSKLLRYFINMRKPDDIMTYIDADWSSGKALISTGFELVDFKEPMEFWINTHSGKREYPDIVLQNHNQAIELKSNKNELDQFLFKNNYIKVYNTGSYKLILKLK